MGKYLSNLENKLVIVGLVIFGVPSIYQFGKSIGKFIYYVTN